jgi:hypothetical protein
MHQMLISTTKVFSVVLSQKMLEIRKKIANCITAEKKQILWLGIELDLSKDRAIHEGDDPSF